MVLGLSLLDKASKVCGSDSKLARQLGVQRAFVSDMRNGRVKISPATAAEMADLAGEDARQAAIDSLIENAKGTRRESILRDVLGKGLAAGVAAMLVFSYNDSSMSATVNIFQTDFSLDNIYIVEYWIAAFLIITRSNFAELVQRFWRVYVVVGHIRHTGHTG